MKREHYLTFKWMSVGVSILMTESQNIEYKENCDGAGV